MKRKKTGVLLLLCVTLVMVGMAILLSNLFDTSGQDTETLAEPPKLCGNEEWLPKLGKISIFPSKETTDILQIDISNPTGSFTLKQNENYGNELRLVGLEGLAHSSMTLSYLTAYSVNPTVVDRITNGDNAYRITRSDGSTREVGDNLGQYNLDPEDPNEQSRPTILRITMKDGEVIQYYIGAQTVLGNGYYARIAGRNEIYIVQNTLGAYANAPATDFLSTTVIETGASTSTPYVNLRLFRRGLKYLDLTYDATKVGTSEDFYIMNYPKAKNGFTYSVDTARMYNICSGFVSLSGTRTVAAIPTGATVAQRREILAEYGIGATQDDAEYAMFYGLGVLSKETADQLGRPELEGQELEFPVLFSKKTERNTYYVAAWQLSENWTADPQIYEIVVEVDADLFYFLELDTFAYVASTAFTTNLSKVTQISVEGNYEDSAFQSHRVEEIIKLLHSKVEKEEDDTASENSNLADDFYTFTCASNGSTWNYDQRSSLTHFYVILSYMFQLEGSVPAGTTFHKSDMIARIRIETSEDPTDPNAKREEKEFTFFRISSTQVAMSLDNGITAEFCLSYLAVNEVLSNVHRIAAGQTIKISGSHTVASIGGFELI